MDNLESILPIYMVNVDSRNEKEKDKPKGVVSKNEVGERRTAFKAARKRCKLAAKVMTLDVDVSLYFRQNNQKVNLRKRKTE